MKGANIATQLSPPTAHSDAASSDFEAQLQSAWPPDRWRDLTVLIAVSGGADSVALLHGLHALHRINTGDGRLIVAHFNHRLRGAASDADEAFVQSLAEQLGLQCVVGRAAIDLNNASGDGLEAAARQARYDFLAKVAGEFGARYIATAHTADDQVETVLFNILRGTGLSGLAGIPRTRQLTEATTIIRPLLDFPRAEVLAYLASLGQTYREDETNQLTDYTRNRIRQDLLPQLAHDYNPRVRDSILRLSQAANQADDFLTQQAETVLGIAARRIAGGFEIDIRRTAHVHALVLQKALCTLWQEAHWPLLDMSREKWDELVSLLQSSSGEAKTLQQDFPGFIRAARSDNTLQLIQARRD